jgi:hypothetical protein
MAIFTATVAAILAGRTVRRARLVRFEFKSETMRLWEGGMGSLRTPSGEVWHGSGELGQVGDIESSIGGTAPQVEFTLSGVDPAITAKARSASDEVKGRPATVLVQHYDEDWQPLDGLFTTFVGTMDTLKISAPAGSQTRVASLMVETLWTRRGFAPFSYISDRDQKRLHPGDRGCEQIASMASKSIKWPQY